MTDRCPGCGGPIRAVVTRGPGDHRVDPCGCRASLPVRRAAMEPLVPDGGVEAGGSNREPFHEFFPPGRAYISEEWPLRTWWGRVTLPFEGALVSLIRLLSKTAGAAPRVYREHDAETGRREDTRADGGVDHVPLRLRWLRFLDAVARRIEPPSPGAGDRP